MSPKLKMNAQTYVSSILHVYEDCHTSFVKQMNEFLKAMERSKRHNDEIRRCKI